MSVVCQLAGHGTFSLTLSMPHRPPSKPQSRKERKKGEVAIMTRFSLFKFTMASQSETIPKFVIGKETRIAHLIRKLMIEICTLDGHLAPSATGCQHFHRSPPSGIHRYSLIRGRSVQVVLPETAFLFIDGGSPIPGIDRRR